MKRSHRCMGLNRLHDFSRFWQFGYHVPNSHGHNRSRFDQFVKHLRSLCFRLAKPQKIDGTSVEP